MAKTITCVARAGLALGGATLAATWLADPASPKAAWFSAAPQTHILVVALLGNLMFIAYPFRRRSDLALGLAIALAVVDMAARASLATGFSDAVGIILVMLPVWAGKLRHRTQKERRRRSVWRHPNGTVDQAEATDLEADLSGDNWIVAR